MNTNDLVEWQRIDPENGLVEPWLTWPFMEWVKTIDLSDKVILEFGAGRSTAWWRKKAKWVDSIDASSEWVAQAENDCAAAGLVNGKIFYDNIPDGLATQYLQKYISLIPEKQYDVVVVDGIYRTEMLQWALDHFKGRGGLLIADNWQQDFVWISPPAEELMNPYKLNRFVQPNHTNHEGRPWNTVYWEIPK